MPLIHYIDSDGSRHDFNARVGQSLMEAALRTNITGIEAKCRGNCCCVTCHVYIDPRYKAVTGTAKPMEESMLDFAGEVDERSRLAYQVVISDKFAGMVVTIPVQRTIGL